MTIFRRQSVLRVFCRGAFCITMAFCLTLATVGTSSLGGITSVANSPQGHQCCCDIQKQRSNNCCCHRKKSCCATKDSPKPQKDDPLETPQFNAYCGTSIPAGAIINNEPRLNTISFTLDPLSSSWQTVEILDDTLFGSTRSVELPPPKA